MKKRRTATAKVYKIKAELSNLPRAFGLVWSAAQNWTLTWIVLLVIQGLLPVATVSLSRLLVNSLVATVGVGISWQTIQTLLMPVVLMACALLLVEFLRSAIEWVRTAQSELVQDYITTLVHEKSVAVDLAFYESSEYYDHLNRARSDASSRSLTLLENSGSLLQNSITLLAMAAILLPYGIWLPALLFLSTLPAFYVMLRLNRRHHQWWQRTTTDRRWLQYYELLLTNSSIAAELRLFIAFLRQVRYIFMAEILMGQELVVPHQSRKRYNLGSYFQSAYQQLRRRLRSENLKLVQDQTLGRLAASAIALIISGVAIAWMARQVLLGIITLGDLALFYQAFNQGQNLIRSLLGNLGEIYKNSLFIRDLFEFLQLEPKVVSPPNQLPIPSVLNQGICFERVTFRYPGSDRAVLTDFNLTIPAGKIVAIVGDNGAGKSTLIKLLCRFYDPEAGCIKLDGIDLRDASVEELRSLITVLFQLPIPYFVTAAQNIALGDLAAARSSVEIEAAARGAGVHETIMRLPQGYDTLLGKWFPGGAELSGGEWQRLALARSFLRRAQIIILDEPTSAMDPWAEFDWLERFRTLANGRTALVITHRFTLAMRADIIHVMRNGQIAESGNHEQLLSQGGLYAQSWTAQMYGDSGLYDEAQEQPV